MNMDGVGVLVEVTDNVGVRVGVDVMDGVNEGTSVCVDVGILVAVDEGAGVGVLIVGIVSVAVCTEESEPPPKSSRTALAAL